MLHFAMLFGTRYVPLPTNAITFTLSRQQHTLPILNSLFHHLHSPPNLHEARRLHALLLVLGFFHPTSPPHSSLSSQLVNVYVNLGSLRYAFLAFNQLPHKPNLAWNAILRALVGAGHFTHAIQFYHSMLRNGVTPDNYTYPLVLKACSSLHSLEIGRWVHHAIVCREIKPNLFVQCAVIDMFVKCGSLEDARRVFEEMPVRDLASWTAMICGTVWGGEWLEALSLFRKMRLEGLKPDSVIVASVLPACGRWEDAKLGMALQGCSVRSGFDSDLYVSNAIIDLYCKCGDPHEARCVFIHMDYKDT